MTELPKIPKVLGNIPSVRELGFPLSARDVSAVHEATLAVLAETGVRFGSPLALQLFKKHAFRVEGERVFFTEKDIQKALETVPKRFTILARNPKHNLHLEPGVVSFGLGRGAVNIIEPDGLHRRGTKEDLIASTKVCQCMDILEHWEPLVTPFDVDPANVGLWMCRAMVEYTDKPYMYKNRHDIEVVALAYGTSKKEITERTDLGISYGHGTGIVHSPLSLSAEDCEDLIEFARCGIAFHIATMPIAGTTGPCTIPGLVVQQNCENLAPIVLSQLVRPGCPVFYGAIGGRTDMRNLLPRFGTPEAGLIKLAGVQMALFYGLLCRADTGLTDAPTCDFQAGAQGMLHTLSVFQSRPNLLLGCGLLGSYLGASLAKIVLDAELVALAKRFLNPVRVDPESLAVDVIAEAGPKGTYIDHTHTLEHYRSEFLVDSIFVSTNYDRWTADGKKRIVELAHEKALEIIASYSRPAMDPGLKTEIDSYVQRHWKH